MASVMFLKYLLNKSVIRLDIRSVVYDEEVKEFYEHMTFKLNLPTFSEFYQLSWLSGCRGGVIMSIPTHFEFELVFEQKDGVET